MSFFNIVFNIVRGVIGTVADELEKKQREVQRQIDRAERRASNIKDDKELARKTNEALKGGSVVDKYAYTKELENRGYLEKDSNNKYKRTGKKFS